MPGPIGGEITMMRLTLLSGLIIVILGASILHLVMLVPPRDDPNAALIGQLSDSSLRVNSGSTSQPDTYLSAYIDFNDVGRAYMSVYVVVDEEFIEYASDDWRYKVYEIIEEADRLTSEAGLGLELHSLGRWHSQDDVRFISSHIQHIGKQVNSLPGLLTLAITGQATTRNDGYVRLQDGVIIVQYDARRPRGIYSLIAHEIGHIVGVNHHDAEEECTEDGCIMDAEGHEYSDTWCTHHKQEIERKLAAIVTTD